MPKNKYYNYVGWIDGKRHYKYTIECCKKKCRETFNFTVPLKIATPSIDMPEELKLQVKKAIKEAGGKIYKSGWICPKCVKKISILSKLDKSYFLRDGCWNCNRVFGKHEHDNPSTYFCTFNAPKSLPLIRECELKQVAMQIKSF